eukprot:INCI7734.1.p1 GENE.INCI7734.1~~INCI7734.1.p1  ORF type:complete len:362 (-),score=46.75 INCI7734.1:346-1431(-)
MSSSASRAAMTAAQRVAHSTMARTALSNGAAAHTALAETREAAKTFSTTAAGDVAGLTPEQRYVFDLQGFVVVKGVLTQAEVAQCNASIESREEEFCERWSSIQNTKGDSAFGVPQKERSAEDYAGRLEHGSFLTWPKEDSQVFRSMLAHPKLVPLLNELVGEGYRLDHMPLILRQRHMTEGFDLHGGRLNPDGSFNRDLAYHFENGRPYCNLLAMSVQLTDSNPGDGGFCIVPGSHKANYPPPESVLKNKDTGVLVHPEMKAGDVVFFSEATMHGASCWSRQDTDRRIVLYRFGPPSAAYGRGYLEGWPKDMLSELSEAERVSAQRIVFSIPTRAGSNCLNLTLSLRWYRRCCCRRTVCA